MGIPGLLPCLKSITEVIDVSLFANQFVAVDAYSWLHKAVHTCARELYLAQRQHKEQKKKLEKSNELNGFEIPVVFVEYCMGWVRALQQRAVKSLLVFDGGPLPQKAWREGRRNQARQAAQEALEAILCTRSSSSSSSMNTLFAKAVEVTPEMAHCLIKVSLATGKNHFSLSQP